MESYSSQPLPTCHTGVTDVFFHSCFSILDSILVLPYVLS